VLVVPQPAPLTVAFEEAMRSRGVSPVANLKNLRVTAQRSGVTKSRSQASRQSSRQPSPQPPPRAASNVAIPPVVEAVTPAPAIRVEADRPYAVAASTPIPATPHNPAASAIGTGTSGSSKAWWQSWMVRFFRPTRPIRFEVLYRRMSHGWRRRW